MKVYCLNLTIQALSKAEKHLLISDFSQLKRSVSQNGPKLGILTLKLKIQKLLLNSVI